MKNLSCFFIACAFGFSHSIQAKQNIPTIVVTNSRIKQDLNDVISATTVITRQEIEASQAQTVIELLGQQAGINVNNQGGIGQRSDVLVRGVSNIQTLVLIDGVRASSADNGEFYWHTLDPDSIERIEIVRGAKSNLYGSDSIGGVIQIITRKSNGYSLKATVGSFNTQKYAITLGHHAAKAGISLAASKERTDGFSSSNTANTFVFNPDDDGSESKKINVRAWVDLTNNLRVSAGIFDSNIESDFDGFAPTDGINFDNRTYSLKLEHNISNNWQQSLQLSQSENSYELLNQAKNSVSTSSTTERKQINWQHNIQFNKQNLILGLDYYKDQVELVGFGNYAKEVNNRSIYVNLSGSFDDFYYALGARIDKHSEFGTHDTQQIELGRRLDKNWTLYGSYGTGFRAPNLTELFFPNTGNASLQPEESRTGEFGLKYQDKNGNFRFSLFDTKISNLIDDDPARGYKYFNVANATIKGLEVQYSKSMQQWQFDTAFTLLDTADQNGKALLGRPDKTLSFGITRHFMKGFVKLNTLSVSKRASGFAATILPGYTIANLSAKYRVNNKLSVGLKIDNLTNRNYQTAFGYNTPDRSYYLSLEYTGSW